MPAYSDFALFSLQAGMFTPEVQQFSQARVLAAVLALNPQLFDGPVQAFNLGPDMPADVPRIVLRSEDEVWRFQAAPGRVDCFWFPPEPRPYGQNYPAETIQVLTALLESNPAIRVGRLALVVNWQIRSDTATQELIDRFCNARSQDAPFNHSQHFEIHNHKTYRLTGPNVEINSWVRCRSVTRLGEAPGTYLTVEQDINTLPEDISRNVFDVESIRQFYDEAIHETKSISRLYFPE